MTQDNWLVNFKEKLSPWIEDLIKSNSATIGRPKATKKYTEAELIKENYKGIYLKVK